MRHVLIDFSKSSLHFLKSFVMKSNFHRNQLNCFRDPGQVCGDTRGIHLMNRQVIKPFSVERSMWF